MMGKVIDLTGKLVLSEVLEHISDGDSVMLTATGCSMLPTFRPYKDKIIISPVTEDQMQVGDVVFFNRGDAVCVHRIIKRKGDRLIIRGDGNSRKALEPARVSAVFARVTGGTMRGGKPFTIEDDIWKNNTARVMKYFPILATWHGLKRIIRTYMLSILVVMVLLYLSFFDVSGHEMPSFLVSDKLVHALMYFGVSSVFWFDWARVHIEGRASHLKGFIYCVLFPIILGVVIEFGQEYLSQVRSGEFGDMLANTAGVILATILSYSVVRPILKLINRKRKK